MSLVPLKIQAGFYRTGTDLESEGRWRDGSLVRWRDNSLRPIGGWSERLNNTANSIVTFTEPPRGAHGWMDNSGNQNAAFGSASYLYHMNASGTFTDITPSILNTGLVSGVVQTGYGNDFYGYYTYGTERPAVSTTITPSTTWALDNFGQNLIAVSSGDGKLYEWDLNTSNDAAVIANAPVNNKAMVVTEERFIFALCPAGNLKKVQWCDREQQTVWTPATTNEAGSIELQTAGEIMLGIRARGQTVVLTTTDAFIFRYSGPPYVYNVDRVGTGCGAISRKCAAAVDQAVYWMGEKGTFFRFDGASVQPLKCDVADYISQDFNANQKHKTWAVNDVENKEVWWFYPSGGSTEVDRYVAYDYQEGHWIIGNLSRTTGFEAGVFTNPIYCSSTKIYNHEFGLNYDGDTVFAESGPIKIGAGDQVMKVNSVIPDESTLGDVKLTFKSRFYPNDTETSHGPFTLSNPTSVRLQGRQVRMRVEGERLADWRVGQMRLNAMAGGGR